MIFNPYRKIRPVLVKKLDILLGKTDLKTILVRSGWPRFCTLLRNGGIVKTKLIIGIFSLVLLVAFQNCGQPGSVQLVDNVNGAPQKLNTDLVGQQDPPLVIDVVDAINDNSDGIGAPAAPATANDIVLAPPLDQTPPAAGSSSDSVVSVPVINNVEEVLADHSCGQGGKKVLICNIPPGNPDAQHTICISRQALDAHKNHGNSAVEHQDYVGACLKQ